MGTDLAGRGRALQRLALKRRSGGREARFSGRRIERLRDGRARLPGGRSSISGRSRDLGCCPPRRGFEAERPISALKIGLERRFAFGENGGISEDMAVIDGRIERFARLALLDF
jgi:hypothetical protein